jgi:hypothetical protein
MKDVLEVNDSPTNPRIEVADSLGKVLRQRNFSENAQIGGIEETQTSFSLEFPKITVCVDDAIS